MVLDRLRRWLGSLFGTDTDGAEADAGVVEPSDDSGETADYHCAVCGTPVGDPDGECSLCHSTDVVPADDATTASAAESGLDAGSATEHSVAADTEAEQRLADLLAGDGDPMEVHAERWERADDGDGYRVERPDGGTERVADETELRAVLGRLYR
jgi:hypothetical protein